MKAVAILPATLLPDRPTMRPRPPAADTTAPGLTRLRAIPKRSRIGFRIRGRK